jgi:hypothetical protein
MSRSQSSIPFLFKYGLRTSPKLGLALCPAVPSGPTTSPACSTRRAFVECSLALSQGWLTLPPLRSPQTLQAEVSH